MILFSVASSCPPHWRYIQRNAFRALFLKVSLCKRQCEAFPCAGALLEEHRRYSQNLTPFKFPSTYRDNVASFGLINIRCRQTSSGYLLYVLSPPGHHRTPAFDVLRSVVSASYFVFINMCQRDFDKLRIPPMLVQDCAGHGVHAMADQAVLKTHSFQLHIASLQLAWVRAFLPDGNTYSLSPL